MESKRVSVVMATYNGAIYIKEQIDSILNQTYPVSEIIIQDDCSTDSTLSIIKEYESKYDTVHVFVNEKNLGYSKNFMTATMRATGDYIALADQDDVWYPEKIEKQVEVIKDNDVCFSQHVAGPDREHLRLVSYKCAPEFNLFRAIVGHSLLMRRDYAQDESNWLTTMSHDIGLSLFGYFGNGVTAIDQPLNWHRSHEKQASKKREGGTKNGYWQPYLYGYAHYKRIQKHSNFILLYSIVEKKSRGRNELVNKICKLLLSDSFTSLLKLCWLCFKHRHTIYPGKVKGLYGCIRGFFFPFIHSYKCDFYNP